MKILILILMDPTLKAAGVDRDDEGSLVLYLHHISGLSFLPLQKNRQSFVFLSSRMTKLSI